MSLLKTTYTGTNTGASTAVPVAGRFSVSMQFTGTGTLVLQRSLDAGTTWSTVQSKTAIYEGTDVEVRGATYRWNCTAHGGSGNIIGILLTDDSSLNKFNTTESDP